MLRLSWQAGVACAACAFAAAAWAGSRHDEIPFAKHTIDLGASETCAFADVNGDGRLDIVSGENWFEAPDWTRHKFREIDFSRNYIDNFSDLPFDVNGDGNIDVVSCSWFSRKLAWWQNPGKGEGVWKEHGIDSGAPIEAAILVDLDNDGKAREVLPQYGSADMPLAWYEAVNGSFVKHVVSGKSVLFGIGAGDVNGDGRNDIVTSKGWFEAPPDPRTGAWTWHPDFTFEKDLSFMYVLDINGDGRNDILTSFGHDYGVFWLEQAPNHRWIQHMIDESWSQAHAPVLADLNGNGRPVLLAGKRYMAHNGKDPGEREPLGIYWYGFEKAAGGPQVEWERHVIDYSTRAGGGMQVAVADFDNDGDTDFAAGGKSGLFLFENLSPANRLTAEEKAAGWQLLFDGKTMAGWEDPRQKTPAGDAWTIQDGCLKAAANPRIIEDLFTKEKFRDFELVFDWRISPGGNSGVKYRIQDRVFLAEKPFKKFEDQVNFSLENRSAVRPAKGQEYVIGFEYQVIDDLRHRDAQRGPKYQAGALYDMAGPVRDATKPVGEFNHSRLVVRGNHVEHWMNGVKVVDADLAEAAKGSAKRWGDHSPVDELLVGQPRRDCPISLQDHNNEAWFRNIKIRRLD